MINYGGGTRTKTLITSPLYGRYGVHTFKNIICVNLLKMKPIFKKRVGHEETVTVSFDGKRWYQLSATMDTGNSGIYPTIGASIIKEEMGYIKFVVQADVLTSDGLREEYLNIEGTITPKVGKEKVTRPVVKCAYIKIGNRVLKNTYVAIADRSFKKTGALINRNLMTELKLVVDPSIKYRFGK